MRVTGSIVIVSRHTDLHHPNLRISGFNTTGSPASNALTAAQMRSGSGGQPGRKASTAITWCSGSTLGSSSGMMPSASPPRWMPARPFVIDGRQQVVDSKPVAQAGDVARYGAVAKADDHLAARPHFLGQLQVVHVGDGALDQGDVDILGEFLDVGDGAVDQVDQPPPSRSVSRPDRGSSCGSRSSRPARQWQGGSFDSCSLRVLEFEVSNHNSQFTAVPTFS